MYRFDTNDSVMEVNLANFGKCLCECQSQKNGKWVYLAKFGGEKLWVGNI